MRHLRRDALALESQGYLKAVKVGNKVRYRTSDIQRILGERDGK